MQELVSLLLWKCNDSIRWYARLLITVVHVICCTICPNFRYDTVLEFITSFWIIFVYLICVAVYCAGLFSPHSAKTTSSTLRRASDPTFYPSWEVMLSSAAPTLSVISYFLFLIYFLTSQTKSLFAFGNLFSVFLLIVMAQVVLSIQVVLFNAEAYAPIVKVLLNRTESHTRSARDAG